MQDIIRVDLWQAGEYTYPGAFGFQPNLRLYLHDDAVQRPVILIIPGGGYKIVSPNEGELVALRFYELGYQTAVLSYSTDLVGTFPLKDQPFRDGSRAVRILRKNAAAWNIDPRQVIVCGFSSGGHLAANLGVHFMDEKETNPSYSERMGNRPDGVILCYPVITSGESAHRDSFTALLGPDPCAKDLEYYSLEKKIPPIAPPFFIWQTLEDEIVPVENSFLMTQALKQAGVAVEYHLFPKGRHGLSLANEDWAAGKHCEPYTLEQAQCLRTAVENGLIPLPESARQRFSSGGKTQDLAFALQASRTPQPDAAQWPTLADQWIRLHVKAEGDQLRRRIMVSMMTPGTPTPGKRHIACVGDSITFGAGVAQTRNRDSYEALLQKLLPENWEAVNFGVSGATAQKQGDVPYWTTPHYKLSHDCDPELCILMLGTNDSKPHNWDHSRFRQDICALIDSYRTPPSAPEIFVMLPPCVFPAGTEQENTFDISEQVLAQEIRPLLQELSAEKSFPLIDLYTVTREHPEYFADGVHPNAAGNAAIAQAIAPVIRPAL